MFNKTIDMVRKIFHYLFILLLKPIKHNKCKDTKHLKVEIKIEYDSWM